MTSGRRMTDEMTLPWVVVAPEGVHWLGHADSEASAWSIALGWPDAEEVAEHKRLGWYAAQATVTWKRPHGVTEAHTDHPMRHYDRTCPACNPGVEGRKP